VVKSVLGLVVRHYEIHRRARLLVVGLLLASTTVTALLAAQGSAYASGTTFTYVNHEQTYTVPAGVTSVTINAVGAPGGAGTARGPGSTSGPGGDGASVTATVPVSPGQILYVEVGGPGTAPTTPPTTQGGCTGAGTAFNGGGTGADCGGGGGGASDVRTCSMVTCPNVTPDTRLVVAGGGGGGGGSQGPVATGGTGGNAGDTTVTGAGPGGTGCPPSPVSCIGGQGGNGGFGPPPGGSTCPGGSGTAGQGGGGSCGSLSIQGFSAGGGGGYDGGGEGGDSAVAGGGGGAGSSYWIPGAVDTSMTDPTNAPSVTITPGPAASGSQVHAVIQVETSPSYGGDPVLISSSQLQASCGGTITFETLQGGSTTAPRTSFNSISVVLDGDGNVTVVVDGADCAPGVDLVEADLTAAPYLTATTELDVEPPQITPEGVSATPADEVETGNSVTSGNSDVYTIFYVETSPVYAEQPVTISSPELENRCGQGWRWEPGSGLAIDQTSGPTVATGTLDDDGNAVFAFKGASCAAGVSTVIADVDAGTHPTYTTTFTIGAPVVTLASTMRASAKVRHHHRRHHGTTGSPAPPAPAITVTASPDPLVETGAPVRAVGSGRAERGQVGQLRGIVEPAEFGGPLRQQRHHHLHHRGEQHRLLRPRRRGGLRPAVGERRAD
jgi:hypothetical protein